MLRDRVMDSLRHMPSDKLNEERKYLTKEFSNDAINKVSKTDNLLFYISPAIEHGII